VAAAFFSCRFTRRNRRDKDGDEVFAFDAAEIVFDEVNALKRVTKFLRVLTFSMTPVVVVEAQALVGPTQTFV
jgi:hypothetical protein